MSYEVEIIRYSKKSLQFNYFGHVVSYNGTNETLTSTQKWKLQRGNLHHLQVSHPHSTGWCKGRQTRYNTVHLTLKITSAQVVERSDTNNSYFQNYPHLEHHTIRTTDTPGFKPFTIMQIMPLRTKEMQISQTAKKVLKKRKSTGVKCDCATY